LNNKFILGVEIGGTKLQVALGDPSGHIHEVIQGGVNPHQGASGILKWMKNSIPRMISRASRQGDEVIGVGCGFGGPLDSHHGRVLKSVQISGWKEFPLKEWLTDLTELPTIVANDSNAAAWGEFKRGIGRGTNQFFYTNMGSGVGGGLIINKQLYDGQGFGAGEFGQSYVPDWTSQDPGQAKKIENLCSGWAIQTRLQNNGYVPSDSLLYKHCRGDPSCYNAEQLSRAAREGDPFSLREIDRIGFSMGLGLANLLCFVTPEVIAIGGGVSKMGDLLLKPIRKYARQHEFINSTGRYTISRAELGDDIVLVGAVLLAAAEI